MSTAEATNVSPQQQSEEECQAETAIVTTNKRRRGERSTNKAEGIYDVISLDPKDGAPLEPEGVHAKWRNRCGKVVRDICKITWEN